MGWTPAPTAQDLSLCIVGVGVPDDPFFYSFAAGEHLYYSFFSLQSSLRQHRTIRLRHLPENPRPDFVTFSCNTQSIPAKNCLHQNVDFLGICSCRIMRCCLKKQVCEKPKLLTDPFGLRNQCPWPLSVPLSPTPKCSSFMPSTSSQMPLSAQTEQSVGRPSRMCVRVLVMSLAFFAFCFMAS